MVYLIIFFLFYSIIYSLDKNQIKYDIYEATEIIISKHKNPFRYVSKDYIYNLRNIFISNADKYDKIDLTIALMKLTSSLKDGHTFVNFYPSMYFPVKFKFIDNDLYIVDISSEYKEFLYSKVISIDNKKIDSIIDTLKWCISYDYNNKEALKYTIEDYLRYPELLYRLNMINSISNIEIITSDNKKFKINSIDFKDKINWSIDFNQKISNYLYLLYMDRSYYWTNLNNNTIYISYKACIEDKEYPIKQFINELKIVLTNTNISKIIIDFRLNGGGNSQVFKKVIDFLVKYKKKIIVITDSSVYSSAVINIINLKKKGAIILGSPPGNNPNHFGEIKTYKLKYSEIVLNYSTKYFKLSSSDGMLIPDVVIIPSIDDYRNNKDTILIKALSL